MISEVLIVHKLMPANQDNQVLPDSRSVTAVVGLNAGHLRSALFVWPSTQVEGCVRTIDFFVFLFRKAMGILLEDI